MAFRGEDWVFDWQKYRDWERAHPGSEVLAGSQDAVVQLYRSYWLYVSPDHKDTVPVYAYPNSKNFASPYLTTTTRTAWAGCSWARATNAPGTTARPTTSWARWT